MTHKDDPQLFQELAELARTTWDVARDMRLDVHWVKAPGSPPCCVKAYADFGKALCHVNGGPAMGMTPMLEGASTTKITAADMDSHKGETPWPVMAAKALELCVLARDEGLVINPWRSSGGHGIHLYARWLKGQDAFSVREAWRRVLAKAGMREGTGGVAAGEVEIFPKQDSIPLGSFGSMFVLPGAGESVSLDPATMAPLGKAAARGYVWRFSEDVEPALRPPQAPRAPREEGEWSADLEKLRAALNAIPNSGADELPYDDWRNIMFGIHHATEGSDEGLELALEFSEKASKHDEGFLRERVWPYIRHDRGGVVTTAGTIYHAAKACGWVDPRGTTSAAAEADDFPVLGGTTAQEVPDAGLLQGIQEKYGLDEADAREVLLESQKEAGLSAYFHAGKDGYTVAELLPGIIARGAEARLRDLAELADDMSFNISEQIVLPPEARNVDNAYGYPEPYPGLIADLVTAGRAVEFYPQPELMLGAVLTGLAAACDWRYRLADGSRGTLYMVSVAESGAGKNAPLKIVREIARLGGAHGLNRAASAAGLEDVLRAAAEGRRAQQAGARAREAPSPAQAHAGGPIAVLWAQDEYGKILKGQERAREDNSLASELSAALLELKTATGEEYLTRARSDRPGVSLPAPMLNIYGSTTPETFQAALTPDSINSGLLGRYIFAVGRKLPDVRPRHTPGRFTVPESFLTWLERKAILARQAVALDFPTTEPEASLADTFRVGYTEDGSAASEEMKDAFFKQSQEADGKARVLLARLAEQVEWICYVLAISERQDAPRITRRMVEWATQFVKASSSYVLEAIVPNVHGTNESANCARVIQSVKDILNGLKPPDGLSSSDWWRMHRKKLIKHGVVAKRHLDYVVGSSVEGRARSEAYRALEEQGILVTVQWAGFTKDVLTPNKIFPPRKSMILLRYVAPGMYPAKKRE